MVAASFRNISIDSRLSLGSAKLSARPAVSFGKIALHAPTAVSRLHAKPTRCLRFATQANLFHFGNRSFPVSAAQTSTKGNLSTRQQITVKQARQVIQKFYDQDPSGSLCQLVDVREAWEIETSNLSKHGWNWIVLPLNSRFSEWHMEVRQGNILDKTLPTFVMCHHGLRSDFVSRFLSEQCGFHQVYNIMGGIHVWSDIDAEIPKY
uniref:Rhodanese family protein n=1 Tax=Tetraselmis sp. GSL018 TaxID=582737 RepID=A0A061QX59_9CHLO